MKINKIFFILMIISSALKAEYIVFKTAGEMIGDYYEIILPITDEQEYKKIYTVLQTYQWPMVIGMANKIDKNELTELTKLNSEAVEEKFLRIKIKEISPEYDIVFIPTLLYEMFYITNLSNYKCKKEISYYFNAKDLSYISSLDFLDLYEADSAISEITKFPLSTTQNIYDFYNKINFRYLDQLSNMHMIINNGLLKFVDRIRRLNFQASIDANINKLFNIINKSKIEPWQFDYLENEAVLKKIIDLEYQARKKNIGILYRAGKSREIYIIGTKGTYAPIEGSFLATKRPKGVPITPAPTYEELILKYQTRGESIKIRDWQQPLNSVSYGNSILAGYWNDTGTLGGGACVCEYLNDPELLGYVLFIDKQKYINGKLDLFFISALNTLTSMYGAGEFFHSRTRAFVPQKYIFEHKGIIDIPGISRSFAFFDNAGIFAPIGDPLVKAMELSKFIVENALILKLPDNEGGFNPKPAFIKSHEKAQKDLTDMLKTMVTVRKYIRAKKEIKEN